MEPDPKSLIPFITTYNAYSKLLNAALETNFQQAQKSGLLVVWNSFGVLEKKL